MIKVKALEWEQTGAMIRGRSGEMRYDICERFLEQEWVWLRSRYRTDKYDSLEAAKAACQAHHEQHVLSMIEIQTGETT